MKDRRSVYSSWDEVLHRLDTLKNQLRANDRLSAEEKLQAELYLERTVIIGCETIRDTLFLPGDIESKKVA